MKDRDKDKRRNRLVYYKEWLFPDEETHHNPQPYTQMADLLADLGYTEEAEDIRIEERKENLQHLGGVEFAWQWIIGRTTGFGYQPQWALAWLVGLIFAGTISLICAAVETRLIKECASAVMKPKWEIWRSRAASFKLLCFQFIRRHIRAVIIALVLVISLCYLMFDKEDPFSVGDIFAFVSIIAVLLLLWFLLLIGRGVDFKNAACDAVSEMELPPNASERLGGDCVKQARKLCSGALLYSIDRAVPFLSFDSEHVKWFKEGHHLNDRPLLCFYFYVHAVLGFALISLFLAGLTGILK